MDQSPGPGGSVRRARERAEAGLPREEPPSLIPIPRRGLGSPPNGGNKPQVQIKDKDGNIRVGAISRPTPVPQWPLAGPIPSPTTVEGAEPYQPPPGKSQPPQRPPRPSRVPSILDPSRMQEPTPIFQTQPQNPRISELSRDSAPETPGFSSRPSTISSVGSIPDFPLPNAPPMAAARRSVNLGPPPSARRGNSSFYSTTSYVSPIPEESPSRRSYASFASSAAIPESFGTISPALSSPEYGYYDDTIADESFLSDDGDDRQLVRSASIGKMAKPSLVTTRSSDTGEGMPIQLPIPRQKPKVSPPPFQDGTGLMDESPSSPKGASLSKEASLDAAVTTEGMLGAFRAASATDPSAMRRPSPSPKPFRLSQLRKPPPLDIGAVRKAEARGSLTSLPDLIRRATRLAAMIDRGKRPASNFNDLDFPADVYDYGYGPRDPEKEYSQNAEKYQSGLSDMLAAFPPPAQANNSRQSIRQSLSSWPLPIGRNSFRRSVREPPNEATPRAMYDAPPDANERQANPQRKKRRCCGLPTGIVVLLIAIIAAVIAAAIIVPVELLVVQKQKDANTGDAEPQLSDCQTQMVCQNGGTNVVVQGVCSCICSNGFTGTTCTVPGTQGCTSTTLTEAGTSSSNLNNVTLGEAIPRLIQEAQANFSISLSPTSILSKFNAANLSCNAENALVTFDGQMTRVAGAFAEVVDLDPDTDLLQVVNGQAITLTVLPDVSLTITIENPVGTGSVSFSVTTLTNPTSLPTGSTIFETTITNTKSATTPTSAPTSKTTPTTSTTTTSTSTTSAATPTNTFTVTEQVLDFSRIAVLLILQNQALVDAATAQTLLQRFFSKASSTASTTTVELSQAKNVTLGGSNSINLVDMLVDAGNGTVGGTSSG